MTITHAIDDMIFQEIRTDNDRDWEHKQRRLQNRLDAMSLADALRYLTVFHLENGFIEDDLSAVRYFPCVDDIASWRFLIQFNEKRGKRVSVGRGGNCALDTKDLRKQQRGLQHFFRLALNGYCYNGLPNPFPYALSHTTIASNEPESQGWLGDAPEIRHGKIRHIVEDLSELAECLQNWITLYNGVGAGSTIDWRHYHCFELPPGHGPFPIQMAAEQARVGAETAMQMRFGGDHSYPVTAFRFSEPRKEAAVRELSSLLIELSDRDPHAFTANLMAVTEGSQVCLYAVPRNRLHEFVVGFPYRVGSMEVFGEFIYSKENDLQDLQQGRINSRRLWNILHAVNLPAAHDL